MILLDSSAWIEFLLGGRGADSVSRTFTSFEKMIIPTLVLHEVGRYFLKRLDQGEVLALLAQLQRGKIIPLNSEIAWRACILGKQWNLASADSIIFSTAHTAKAKLITFDNDFRGLPGVVVLS